MQDKENSMEEAFAELESVIGKMEGQDVSLEETFSLYRRGMELLKDLNGRIDRVEKQMLELDEDGNTHEYDG